MHGRFGRKVAECLDFSPPCGRKPCALGGNSPIVAMCPADDLPPARKIRHRIGAVIRTSSHRLTALLAALVFLFTWTGDALGLQPCPHHSSVPGAVAHASAEHAGHAAGADHAAHAEHGGAA